jgi:hypothetical protein
VRIARSTGVVSGLLVVLLGVWGALIPFVGPYFDYSFGSNATWHYTADRLWLNILPGAVAVLAGLLLLRAMTRRAGAFGGWLGLLAGAWFVVGPAVSLTWEHARGPIGPPLGGGTRQMLELVGYFYGLGAVVIALVAFASGRFVSRPQLADDAGVHLRPTPFVAEPPTTTPAVGSTTSTSDVSPQARRFSLRRR